MYCIQASDELRKVCVGVECNSCRPPCLAGPPKKPRFLGNILISVHSFFSSFIGLRNPNTTHMDAVTVCLSLNQLIICFCSSIFFTERMCFALIDLQQRKEPYDCGRCGTPNPHKCA